MLYQLYENQRSLMEPFADFAKAAAKMYGNPLSPLGQNQFTQRLSASYDMVYRLGKDYEKPVFCIHTVDVNGVGVAISERVEINKPFCELRRFKRFSDDVPTLERLKDQPVVLIVAPLSGHYATLLRDTVKTMLKDHKVYITDWKNARLVPLEDGEFHLDDYVNYVEDFIRHLQEKYGNCHVISVCQPTVPVLAAVSLMATRGEKTPLSMTMMGGPIDARSSPTAVNNLATNKPFSWFENNVIYRVPANFPGKGRRVYPGFMQHTGFVAMNPNRHATSHYDYFKNLIKGDGASTEAHRKFYDEYNAVLDMDANYYLETIATVFQDFKLVNGTWDVKNADGVPERVRPQDIKTTALLTVEGELDDISGSGQTKAALGLCSGIPSTKLIHLEAEGAGHYGIFSGRRWRDVVYPVVKRFILDHNVTTAQAKPPVAKEVRAQEAIDLVAPSKPVVATPPTTPVVQAAPVRADKPAATPAAADKAVPAAVVVAAVAAPVAVPAPAVAVPAVVHAPVVAAAPVVAPVKVAPPPVVAVQTGAAPVVSAAAKSPVATAAAHTPKVSAQQAVIAKTPAPMGAAAKPAAPPVIATRLVTPFPVAATPVAAPAKKAEPSTKKAATAPSAAAKPTAVPVSSKRMAGKKN